MTTGKGIAAAMPQSEGAAPAASAAPPPVRPARRNVRETAPPPRRATPPAGIESLKASATAERQTAGRSGAVETRAPAASVETRGRPADVALLEADDGIALAGEEDPSLLTRRSLTAGDENPFTVPPHLCKPGWAYQWSNDMVLGQPADPSDKALEFHQGWRPAPAADFRELLGPGYRKRTVQLKGCTLMMRPKRLDLEAKEEQRQKAEQMKTARLRSALTSDPGTKDGHKVEHDSRMPRVATSITLEGEVGVHREIG